MSEWQPIETAPKDGTNILVFTPKGKARAGVVCGIHCGWWTTLFDEWTTSDGDCEMDPTHWMPLPEPPP